MGSSCVICISCEGGGREGGREREGERGREREGMEGGGIKVVAY